MVESVGSRQGLSAGPRVAPRFFIIDAMALAFRAHYAFSHRPLTTRAGRAISALFGTATMLTRLIEKERPDFLAIACDSQEPTFRHRMYPAYKANRSAMPEDLAAQMPDLLRLLGCFGVPLWRQPGVEADDLIGTLARVAPATLDPTVKVYIVSGDKDFQQLVDTQTFLYVPKTGDTAAIVDAAGVLERFGVPPKGVVDCLALIGDASDNVPGVKGIGEKGAAKLLTAYGSLDGLYDNLDAIANPRLRTMLASQRANAYLSRELVTIKTDLPLRFDASAHRCMPEAAVANESLLSIYTELELHSLIARVRGVLRSKAASSETTPPSLTSAPTSKIRAGAVAAPATIVDREPRYRCVVSAPELAALEARLSAAAVFAFDTETTGLDVVGDRPIGVSFGLASGEAFYVPCEESHLRLAARVETGGSGIDQPLSSASVRGALGRILGRSQVLKVGHNCKFDLQMLANIGIDVAAPLADTMVMDHLLDADGSHGLDACCRRHLGYEKIKTSTLIGPRGEHSMLDADLGELTRYACEDADLTLQLYRCLAPQIEVAGLNRLLEDVEMPLVPILARMEKQGVFVDGLALRSYAGRLETMADDLKKTIYREADEEFNTQSTRQTADILFTRLKLHETLGVKALRKTKTGYSTDEDVLRKLSAHPLPRALLELRAVTKLKGTYVDPLPALAHPKTGRVHASFHQTGTATGRLSSSSPNLQNIPIRTPLGREIRRAFRAQNPEWVLVSADYSQIELRLLAHLANDDALVQAFANDEDVHRATAAKIFGVEPTGVDESMRAQAKAINFGIIYGMGPRRLAEATGVTIDAAKAFIDRYLGTYPGIAAFVRTSIQEARQGGYARTITGRRRPMAALFAAGPRGGAQAENIAVNTKVQGSAADLIKVAMIRVEERLAAAGLKARLLLQVHDELVFECPKAEAPELVSLVTDAMQGAMTLSVPLKVGVGVGATWFDAH